MTDALTRSAILYGTDKFGYHDYTPNYFKLFAHLKDAPVKVLEIGVGGYADDDRGGQSLEVWRDFFPNGEITGIDIQKKTMDLGPRVEILQGSQVDADFLKELVEKRGPFDIIIDDGSHRNEHIVESYGLLFPTLKAGGIYVAEDVQTSFHPRFGGSLEMTAPNAVGYFGNLQRQLGASSDPLIADVAGMERFHNMIALHKKQNGTSRDVFTSNLFETLNKPSVRFIGDAVDLPFATGKTVKSNADLLICTVDGMDFDQKALEKAFGSVAEGGIMVIRADDPTKSFDADGPLMAYAQQRFTQVDHVEMVVNYPHADIDSLAAQIYSVERFEDAIVLHKSPNAYPSNFAFNPDQPQAAKALAHMEDVLQDATTEGGLVQYADILTRHKSREAAAAPIAKLTALGAASRQYFQMAAGLAQREKRLDDAAGLLNAALEKFPYDPQFSSTLAGIYNALRRTEEAEIVLRESLEMNPRARGVVAALTKILMAREDNAEAAELISSTVKMFPQPMRPARLAMLSEVQRKMGDLDAAHATMSEAIAVTPDDVLVLAEMSKVLHAQDDYDAAVDFAAQALEKAPDDAALQAWQAQITS